MKIRILSDLHLDINEDAPFSLADSDIFTVICGDISANTAQAVKWINANIKQGILIEGNHIGYDSKHSIQYLEDFLANYYPLNAPVSYLKNNYKIIDDVVFVGGILWTDFELYGEANRFFAKNYAMTSLNDFIYNYVNIKDISTETEKNFHKLKYLHEVRKLQPNDYINMFNATLKSIKLTCEMFPDKKIVVVTHHAPSEQSISSFYKTNKSNLAYASNLEQFILEHHNIVLWCHGHIHSKSDYFIDKCRIVCNPRGYEYREDPGFDNNFVIEV